jgi:hypothetical protein
MRLVESSRWKLEQEEDARGFKKVMEIEAYKGVFKDSKNMLFDLRPKESCPSINNFKRMEKLKLQNLLFDAY